MQMRNRQQAVDLLIFFDRIEGEKETIRRRKKKVYSKCSKTYVKKDEEKKKKRERERHEGEDEGLPSKYGQTKE